MKAGGDAAFGIGFDLDHTLLIDNRLERTVALEMLAALARARGVAYVSAAAERAIDEALGSFRAGRAPLETALEGFLLEMAGPGDENSLEAGRFRETAVERAPEFVAPLPGLEPLLAALDEIGVPYAALSNGWSPLQEEKARLIKFAAPVFVSERIGARKPSREAFAFLANHLNLPFERVWYVGDDPRDDCGGALAVGMRAIWVDRGEHAYPADLLPPTYTITALEQLPPIIQGHLSGAANPTG